MSAYVRMALSYVIDLVMSFSIARIDKELSLSFFIVDLYLFLIKFNLEKALSASQLVTGSVKKILTTVYRFGKMSMRFFFKMQSSISEHVTVRF